jgi:hypothetical protein
MRPGNAGAGFLALTVVLAVLALAWPAGRVGATDYYVAKSGSDGNAGSAGLPWLTITKAANTLQAGDTAYIKAGTYNEHVVVNVQGSAAGGFITFRNYAGDVVYVDGTGINLGVWPYGGVIEASGKSYLRFQGLHIQNCQGNAGGGISLFISGGTGASHIEILDNEITAHTGITALGCIGNNLSYVTIDNNEVHQVNTNAQEAIRVAQDVRYFRITNNRVHDTSNIGIDAVGWGAQPTYGLIQNNVCYQNAQASDWAHGIYVDGGSYILIENNLVYDSRCGIELGAEYATGVAHNVIARHNTVRNCWQVGLTMGGISTGGRTQDCAAVHNTLVNNNTTTNLSLWTSEFSVNYSQGTNLLMNNIAYDTRNAYLHQIYNADGNAPANFIYDYNCYYNLNNPAQLPALFWYDTTHYAAALPGWQALSGQDAHTLAADPGFVNLGANDFHLQTGSPCIDSGGFLARTTGAGSGTLIPVTDARAFCDGYGGWFSGDAIRVGAQTVNLLAVDYANRTLQVDRSLSWALNDGVSLPYNGSAPDRGAWESGVPLPSPMPTSTLSPTAAGIISGLVSEQTTGLAISGAIVSADNVEVLTNTNGAYQLALSGGGHLLQVVKNGYALQSQRVTLQVGVSLTLNWQLYGPASLSPTSGAAEDTGNWSVSPATYVQGKSPVPRITFSHLPNEATIRIYTLAGKLVILISHHTVGNMQEETWDVSNVASGIYFYHIQSPQAEKKGKLSIIK